MFQEIQDWQAARLGKITASELHRLMASGKKKDEYFGKTALSYIDEKISELLTGQPVKDLSGLNAIEWGNAHEAEAISYLEQLIGIPVEPFGGQNNKFFPLNQFSGGSPDALTEFHLVENKCPYNSSVHIQNLIASYNGEGSTWMKEYRKEHYIQMQMNMMCTKRDKGLYVSYDPRPIDEDHRMAIIEVQIDNELCVEIEERIFKAAEIISNALEVLAKKPSILIAHHDKEVHATMVQ